MSTLGNREVDKIFQRIWEYLKTSNLESTDVASLLAMIQANLLANILVHSLNSAEDYLKLITEATLQVLAREGWTREKFDA